MKRKPPAPPPESEPLFGAASRDSPWLRYAAQSFIWSQLLLAIPKLVRAHVAARTLGARPRLEELEAFFPNDPEIDALRMKLDPAHQLGCELASLDPTNRWACTTARIFKTVGHWQERGRLVAVEFALCRDGDLKVHCIEIQARRALPAFVDGASSTREARAIAETLVADAIRVIEAET